RRARGRRRAANGDRTAGRARTGRPRAPRATAHPAGSTSPRVHPRWVEKWHAPITSGARITNPVPASVRLRPTGGDGCTGGLDASHARVGEGTGCGCRLAVLAHPSPTAAATHRAAGSPAPPPGALAHPGDDAIKWTASVPFQ